MEIERETKESTDVSQVKAFLEGYLASKKVLSMLNYEKDFFRDEHRKKGEDPLALPFGDETLLRAKMFSVRRFIMGLEDGNEKALLFFHYIRGFSVEKCAEMMNVGRASAFRIKKRALLLAAEKYESKIKKGGVPRDAA